jgi:predicted NodU family carbamoyl transferase
MDSTLAYYTGFKVNSGEYEVIGLAPCGGADRCKNDLSDAAVFFCCLHSGSIDPIGPQN